MTDVYTRAPTSQPTVTDLVLAARANDSLAWEALVQRFAGLVWHTCRTFTAQREDALDAAQTVWLRLAENLETVRDPERLGLWLATTARNECLRLLRRQRPARTMLEQLRLAPMTAEGVDSSILEREERRALFLAIDRLPASCRTMVRLFLCDPPLSYADISAILKIPIGSIGPRRQRCLRVLRAAIDHPPTA